MLVWLVKKILFIIILQPFIFLLLFFVIPPGFYRNFDYFLKGRSPIVSSIERQFMESIIVKREFSTKELFRNSEYKTYCVTPREVDPTSQIPENMRVFHNMGGWGWNSDAWHITLIGRDYAVVFEAPTYLSFEGGVCGRNIVISMSASLVFVAEQYE